MVILLIEINSHSLYYFTSKRKDYANLVRRLTVGFDDGEELSDEDDDVDLMETDQQLKRKEKFYAKQVRQSLTCFLLVIILSLLV